MSEVHLWSVILKCVEYVCKTCVWMRRVQSRETPTECETSTLADVHQATNITRAPEDRVLGPPQVKELQGRADAGPGPGPHRVQGYLTDKKSHPPRTLL